MSEALETFFGAWSQTDAAARTEAIAASMAASFIYSDPRSSARLTALDALSDYVGQFSANAPGWTASVEATDGANSFVRARVAFGGTGPDGTQMVQHGTYFADLDGEGRIVTLAGFVGTEIG